MTTKQSSQIMIHPQHFSIIIQETISSNTFQHQKSLKSHKSQCSSKSQDTLSDCVVSYRSCSTIPVNTRKAQEHYQQIFIPEVTQVRQPLLQKKVKKEHNLVLQTELKDEEYSQNTRGPRVSDGIRQFQSNSLSTSMGNMTMPSTTVPDFSVSPSLLSTTTLISQPRCKPFSPFSKHQIWICNETLLAQQSLKNEKTLQQQVQNDSDFSILSTIRELKRVEYLEHHRKQNCLLLHLIDSQSFLPSSPSPSPSNPFDIIESNTELSQSVFLLNSMLNNLPKQTKSFSSRQFKLSAVQNVTQLQKPCFVHAYSRNSEGEFELKEMLLNEKFLIYTKWDLETYMMTVLNNGIEEMFTSKNYSQILTKTFNSISSALSESASNIGFSAELKMKDQNIREIEASVESIFDTKNDSLYIRYTIEKVLSERKPIKYMNSKPSITCFSNQHEIGNKRDIQVNKFCSNQTLKRKASSSLCYLEELNKNSIGTEEGIEEEDNNNTSFC